QIIEIMRGRGYEVPQEFVDQYEAQMNIINDGEFFDPVAIDTLMQNAVKTGSLEEYDDKHEIVDLSYLEQAYTELGMADEIPDMSGMAAPAEEAMGEETMGEPSELSSIAWGNFNANYLANVLNELADENGWLQEYGIEEQEVVIMDQELVFPALIGGSLQIALQDTDAVAGAHLAGADLVYIANYRDREPWILTVREGVDITNPEGLTCSGGGAGGRNEFNAREMIKRLGGDPELVEWIPIGGGSDSRAQAFVEGQIDCVQHFDRHRAMVTEAGGVTVYDELENVPQDGFVVTREFAESNPRFLVNYLKGLIKARRMLNDLGNKDQIIEIMRGRGYEVPQEFVDQYEAQMNIINDGEFFDPVAMDTLMQDAVKTGSLEEYVDWHEFVDLSYLEQAYTELGMEIPSYE
ncbi:MAG: ABC transporter substrate-binding protein, partial [Anaerolineae bacterium]|nr:ABC transporter substrate-binding protein [Anaerolineae bacterium]